MDELVQILPAAVLCTFLIVLLSANAERLQLLDHPNDRKRHGHPVPLVGGLALCASVVVLQMLFLPSAGTVGYIATLLPIAVLGFFDDRLDLPASWRFLMQAGIAAVAAAVGGFAVTSLGDVLGTGTIGFEPWAAIVFTAFCIAGVINGVNMTDGVDGLLGSVALATFVVLAVFAHGNAHYEAEYRLILLFIGGIAAYLAFNLSVFGASRRVFLGDSGSMVIGCVLALLMIKLSQGPSAVFQPVVAGWLLGLPLLDTVVVMVRRAMQGKSPFHAGRDHLHHLLLDRGIGKHQTVGVLLLLHLSMLGIGVLAAFNVMPDALFFWGFVALTLTHFMLTLRLIRTDEGELRT